jgi:hypothetical protein
MPSLRDWEWILPRLCHPAEVRNELSRCGFYPLGGRLAWKSLVPLLKTRDFGMTAYSSDYQALRKLSVG